MSEELHFYAVDKQSGETLIDERFANERLSAARFLDYRNLEWIFGTDAGSPGFRIKNFAVEAFAADPVALTAVEIDGAAQAVAGSAVSYHAKLTPENATVKSYTWLVGGKQTATGVNFNYLFAVAGKYDVMLRVEDYSGNTLEKTLTVTVTAPPVVYAPGDIDGDGSITAADAQLLADHLTGKVALTDEQLTRADCNEDGKVDLADVYAILCRKEGAKS